MLIEGMLIEGMLIEGMLLIEGFDCLIINLTMW